MAKDREIDELLQRLISRNKIEIGDKVLKCYDLRENVVKKRKSGGFCSRKYFITNVNPQKDCSVVFDVNILDIIDESYQNIQHKISPEAKLILEEETGSDDKNAYTVTYLHDADSDFSIPVSLDDYEVCKIVDNLCKKLLKRL